LLQLTNHYSDYVIPLLSGLFKQSAGLCGQLPLVHSQTSTFYLVTPAVDLESVIQKEALYCALGRCAFRLKDEIPFNQWLQHTLSHEAKESNNPKCVSVSFEREIKLLSSIVIQSSNGVLPG
jgi:uncharacterized protein YbaR (Trm112 family)